jgi:sulfite reductase (NADPH) hemoprotein beta-component
MYTYSDFDRQFVRQRAAQFRDQLERHLAGTLSADDFGHMRRQNGWYIQRHAPMARIAVPYGVLGSDQLRQLARIARTYDRGYGHFTTRTNMQFNWIPLERAADVMDELAEVGMHGIQTCGNCIRNITADAFAGVAADEIADPRPFCEIMRQWSSLHPEFAALPRKFKIAVNGAHEDRAATGWYDVGLQLLRNSAGELGFQVKAGGGMGRTPMTGTVVREFLPWPQLLAYLEAIFRIYNRYGRRDNLWKARIKILVRELGQEKFRETVEAEWAHLKDGPSTLIPEEIERIESRFTRPARDAAAAAHDVPEKTWSVPGFRAWSRRNVHAHRVPGYAAVTLSLKKTGVPPGDVTSEQMDALAELADRYSGGELRVTHEQNLVLADVRRAQLGEVWQAARALGLATPNIGLLTDLIACPGGDFCALANAKSLPVAEAIQRRFEDLDYLFEIGEIDLNISGCINACGHHHIGHIGILGVDKNGEEWYQIEIGGNQGKTQTEPARAGSGPALGRVLGPSFARAEVPDVVERLIRCYLARRDSDAERFIDVVHRIGIEPFKEHVYGNAHQGPAHRRGHLASA